MSFIGRIRSTLRGPVILAAGVIAALTWGIYWPVLRGGWLWDDRAEVLNNLALRSRSGLSVLWLHPPWPDYYPVKSTVQWLLWHGWGTDVAAYHAANIGLHLLGALLFWRLLSRLGLRFAWLGGLLFAVHPLAVESVAWMSELKNTLSLPFALLSFLAYQDSEADPARGRRSYLAALVWFIIAMLCKASVVTLPVIFLCYLFWRHGRLGRAPALRLIPFFLAALTLGVVTLWFQVHRAIGMGEAPPPANVLSTLSRAVMALGFYVYKFLIPIGLLPIYPRWPLGPERWWTLISGTGFLALFAWSCLWLPTRPPHPKAPPAPPRRRAAYFGLACLLATLAPILGFAPMAYLRISSVADHFAYLALLPMIGLVVAGAGQLSPRISPKLVVSAGLVIATALAWQSHTYSRIFREEEGLWRYTQARNPTSAIVADNLAITLASKGRLPEALPWFERSSQLSPDFAQAWDDLGMALVQNGRSAEAIPAFQRAVSIKPNFPLACDNLGMALEGLGRFAEARDSLQQALAVEPKFAEARNHLGLVLADLGLWSEAIAEYRRAIHDEPDQPSTYSNLGSALNSMGRPREAASADAQALELQPDFPEAHNNLGNALFSLGQPQRAIHEYTEALRLQPAYPEAENNLGYALDQAGRAAEASEHYLAALKLRPAFAEAHTNLGNLYFKTGRAEAAIGQYQAALRLNPRLTAAHNNLGVAYQQTGQLPEAVAEYRESLRLQPAHPRAELNLGTALASMGADHEALLHYERALRLDNHFAEAYYKMGESLERLGRWKEAISHYHSALQINPTYAAPRTRLQRLEK